MNTPDPKSNDLHSDPGIPNLMHWLNTVADAFELPRSVVMPRPLLEVSKDVAHTVLRPGAPTSTYLMGVSMGLALAEYRHAAQPSTEEAEEHVMEARMRELAAQLKHLAAGHTDQAERDIKGPDGEGH